MKTIVAFPIIIALAGIFLLFAGSRIADSEERIATAIGNLVASKWIAGGLILIGGLWFASEEGLLKL